MSPPPVRPKQIELELTWHHVGKFYKVTKIVNSTYYAPGESIPPDRVALLCSDTYPNWTVSMVDYDYVAPIVALFGALTSVAKNAAVP